MAKQSVNDCIKKTSVGESIEEIKRAEQESLRLMDNMKEYINTTVEESNKKKTLPEHKFYVIQVNYFYCRQLEDNTLDYCPAEIGIAEFSLQHGVERVYHEIITPKIRVGYAYEAKSRSALTHNLPSIENDGFPSKEFNGQLLADICKFLQPGRENGRLPPLYTRFAEEDLKFPVENVMEKLTNEFGSERFRIYSLEELFASLYNVNRPSGAVLMNSVIANMELKKDPYEYKKGTECKFHQDIGAGKYCSQSMAQRWTFVISNHCCPSFGIKIEPNYYTVNTNQVDGINCLSAKMGHVEINEKKNCPEFATGPPTGAIRKYTKTRAERSQSEEEYRKFYAASEPPLHIVQHGNVEDVHNAESIFPREFVAAASREPATAPRTSFSTAFSSPSTDSDDSYQNDFPPLNIGRGGRRTSNMPPKPVNYASKLKK
ncbi:protein maelstrom homolog isoform X2 [Copidosoma floridanum]|nr:protein maelstrom homolog isoform X2 [Copidosoma floridanum]